MDISIDQGGHIGRCPEKGVLWSEHFSRVGSERPRKSFDVILGQFVHVFGIVFCCIPTSAEESRWGWAFEFRILVPVSYFICKYIYIYLSLYIYIYVYILFVPSSTGGHGMSTKSGTAAESRQILFVLFFLGGERKSKTIN